MPYQPTVLEIIDTLVSTFNLTESPDPEVSLEDWQDNQYANCIDDLSKLPDFNTYDAEELVSDCLIDLEIDPALDAEILISIHNC